MIDRYLQRHVKLIHTGEGVSSINTPQLLLFMVLPHQLDVIYNLRKSKRGFKICAFPEERNYICDQCGQTFKQRKHLSVHQMRHSGAKPLQ